MKEGRFREMTPLPTSMTDKTDTTEESAGQSIPKATSPRRELAASAPSACSTPTADNNDTNKKEKEKNYLATALKPFQGRKKANTAYAVTGEDREWASRKFVYERRFDKPAPFSSLDTPATTTTTASPTSTSPSASPNGNNNTRPIKKHHTSMLTLGRNSSKNKSDHRAGRKSVDLEDALPSRRGSSFQDFKVLSFFSTDISLPLSLRPGGSKQSSTTITTAHSEEDKPHETEDRRRKNSKPREREREKGKRSSRDDTTAYGTTTLAS